MNLAELLNAARVRLDDTVEPYRWSDDLLTQHFNDAVRQAAIRKRLVFDRSTASCCSYAVAAEATKIRLNSAVLCVRSARWSGSSTPLTLTTLKRMDRKVPDWPSTPADVPTVLIVDAETGALVPWPSPAAAGTLTLAIWRAPLESELLEGSDDEPIIDEIHHADLVDWVEHLAYLSPDGETEDTARSDRAASRFTAKFGDLPSAREMTLWAIGRDRGQTAQFI